MNYKEKNINENKTAKQMIKTAVDMIKNQDDYDIENIHVLTKIVKNHPEIISKINILKQIAILDSNTLNYLHSIKLTDDATKIEPKLNVIWQLVKNAGLVDEKDIEKESEEDTIPLTISANDDIQNVAIKVINKLLDR